MKTVKSTSAIFSLLMAMPFLFLSCSKGSSPAPVTPQSQATALLTSGPWKLQSSSVDGVDQTALYNDFTITFATSSFTTTNGRAIWPASGTWSFSGTSTTTIIRNDGVAVQLQLSSTSLVMAIAWTKTTLGPGRTEATSGNNVFTMTH